MTIEVNGQKIGEINLNTNTIGEVTVNGQTVFSAGAVVAYSDLIAWYPFDSATYGGSNADDVTAILGGSSDNTAYDGNAQSVTYRSSGGGNDPEAGNSSGYYDFTNSSSVIRMDGRALDGLTDYTLCILVEGAQSGEYFVSVAKPSDNNVLIFDGSGLSGGWNHVAITRNGSSTAAYINGNQDSSFLYQNSFGDNPFVCPEDGFVLGQEQDSVGGDFDSSQDHEGGLDDLRIYNRGLSQSEINQIVSNTLP